MRRIAAVSGMLFLASCLASRGGQGTRDRAVIQQAEIESLTDAQTAFDIVTRLRSEFLRSRGTVTRTTATRPVQAHPPITVFVDEVEAGPVERTLHLIPAREVEEIRLFRATDAATKYGSRHNGGVIAVKTKRHEP